MTHPLPTRPTTLADYLAILNRRKWLILLPLILAPAVTVLLSSRQEPLYRASADVYVKRSDVAVAVAGVTNPALQQDPVRYMQTQADVARDPKLAQMVVDAAGIRGLTRGAVLADSSVTPRPDADILTVAATDTNRHTAVRLANTYADQFTKFRTQLDTARIDDALTATTDRMRELRASGASINSPAYVTLVQNEIKLQTIGKLLAKSTEVLRPATGAGKIRPQTRRDAIFSALLGLVLGLALAFAAEALDKRVRSEQEIDDILRMPLLGRLPKPTRHLRKANQLVMLAEPRSIAAEPVRKLRTNIEFVNHDLGARTILATSSIEREGKSTTLANLAVALARAGRNVAIVDLDLRRPFLHRFFRIPAAPGVTDVVFGRAKLEEALRPVALTAAQDPRSRNTRRRVVDAIVTSSSNGHSAIEGALTLLPAGTIPPDAGELVADDRLSPLLEQLAARFDFVLVDAPPLLAVGDALTLSSKVDAVLVLVRLKVARRGMLHEVGRLLESCPAAKLGYVLASAELGADYGYGYAYAYEAREAAEPAATHGVR